MIERVELAPGYSISRLIHGGWQFSRGHRLEGHLLDDAVDVLEASAELGVTTFDCADIYTGVEELYGRFISRWKTRSVATPLQIHTKLVPDYDVLPRIDRTYVAGIVERSLRRLRIERVDLVQFYWWRDDVPGMEDAAGWLLDLQRAGKIRHLAVTNFDVDRLGRLVEAGIPIVSDQVQYSLLDRRPENGLVAYAQEKGIGLIAFGALAGGLLTDRWSGSARPERPSSRSQVKYELVVDEFGGWERYQALLADLAAIGLRGGVGAAPVALRSTLDRPGVRAVVCGATRLGQMRDNAAAFDVTITRDDQATIERHLADAPGPEGPVFGLERDRSGRHGRIMRYDLNELGPGSGDRPGSAGAPPLRDSPP